MNDSFTSDDSNFGNQFHFTPNDEQEICISDAKRIAEFDEGDGERLQYPRIMVLNSHGPTSPKTSSGTAAMRKRLSIEIINSTYPDIILISEPQWRSFTNHVDLKVKQCNS
jgi:hypothetical protein